MFLEYFITAFSMGLTSVEQVKLNSQQDLSVPREGGENNSLARTLLAAKTKR